MEEVKKEAVEPKISTAPVVEKKEEVVGEKKKKSKAGLYIIIAVLATFVVCLAMYFVYTKYIKDLLIDDTDTNTSKEVEETTDDLSEDDGTCSIDDEDCDTEDTTEVLTTELFEGEVLTATIKKDWKIIEYLDGNGTEYLMDGETYDGLTGFEIKNPDGDRVFSMMAVTGIGFAGCPNYAEFEDDSPSYYAEMEDAASTMGDPWTPKDLTNASYKEFEFLGTTVRRIARTYYYDTLEGNNYFEAPCVDGIISLEGLVYTDSYGYQLEAYFYGAEETAVEADLLVVDDILDGLELVN